MNRLFRSDIRTLTYLKSNIFLCKALMSLAVFAFLLFANDAEAIGEIGRYQCVGVLLNGQSFSSPDEIAEVCFDNSNTNFPDITYSRYELEQTAGLLDQEIVNVYRIVAILGPSYGVEAGNEISGPNFTPAFRESICIAPFRWDESTKSCIDSMCPQGTTLNDATRECKVIPDKNTGCTGANGEGNPCNVATGNKYQSETDFSNNGISLVRSYNSLSLADNGLGLGWRSNHQKSLLVTTDSLTQVSATGRGEPWLKVNGIWQGDADSDELITENTSGFQLTNASGSVENYNFEGQLLSTVDINSHQINYVYNIDDRLDQVTNHYGQSISFSYTDGNIATVTDSLGEVYSYEYDVNNNFISVIYPDTTPSDNTDNPRKIYHYENVDYPNQLTGITDENGNRYANYAYDADGKANTTEHSQTTNPVGQEKFELDYQGAN